MTLRLYLFSLYLSLILSAGLTLFIIFNVDPSKSPFWMILIFYLTFFIFWLALFSLISFYLKIWISNREVIFAHLLPTLRQSALMSLAIIGLLFLQQVRVLTWWIGGLYIIAIIMIELFFRSKKKVYGGRI